MEVIDQPDATRNLTQRTTQGDGEMAIMPRNETGACGFHLFCANRALPEEIGYQIAVAPKYRAHPLTPGLTPPPPAHA